MDYKDIREIIAPCGIDCKKCIAYSDGYVKEASTQLGTLLGPNFHVHAERFSKFYPALTNYQSFKEILQFFMDASCPGCRNGHPQFPTCGVATCSKIASEKFDFCFQCEEFPCDRPEFHPGLDERWRKKNKRMAEIGVEKFYEETKDEDRYP
jgi:hypothetical protein